MNKNNVLTLSDFGFSAVRNGANVVASVMRISAEGASGEDLGTVTVENPKNIKEVEREVALYIREKMIERDNSFEYVGTLRWL